MMDRITEKEFENCRKIILEDEQLKQMDAIFYDLLDAVERDVAVKLEEAYLEYGARAVELAYLQGIQDGKERKKE